MDYKQYKETQEKISLLGFGCMRLPLKSDNTEDIDFAAGQEMVDYALKSGVNYFDTAYVYHNGKSEPFVGQALKKHPRDSFNIATKLPIWLVETKDDVHRYFDEQLQRLEVDYFDYYLMHNYTSDQVEKLEGLGVYDMLKQKQEKGLIRHLGFSIHDNFEGMKKIMSLHDWDFVQLQINYLDWDMLYAKLQYEYAREKGVPVIVMEPVRGGTLADLKGDAAKLLGEAAPGASYASWGMRFAGGLDGILTVLSGMTTLGQVQDNVKTFSGLAPLTQKDRDMLKDVAALQIATGAIPCTGCNYCMDCPQGVDIPRVFGIYNGYCISHNPFVFRDGYNALDDGQKAANCTACKTCVSHCPQKIDIPARLEEVAYFSDNIVLP